MFSKLNQSDIPSYKTIISIIIRAAAALTVQLLFSQRGDEGATHLKELQYLMRTGCCQ